MEEVKRIYVEKKPGFDVEARHLLSDLQENLNIKNLQAVRILNRYDLTGIDAELFRLSREIIFAEPPVDRVYEEKFPLARGEKIFAMEYLPGQYDQRADSAAQCVQIFSQKERPEIQTAKIVVLDGDISATDFLKIKNYCINPVDSREASLEKPASLAMPMDMPEDVAIVAGFINMSQAQLQDLMKELGLAMSFADLLFCQKYFRDEEKRNPTLTEIKVIDTYWSDHCRHTTFATKITDVDIEKSAYTAIIKEAYQEYQDARKAVYQGRDKDICLMDIAVMGMKEARLKGLLPDLEVSDEINACSIVVNVDVDGENQEWLVMFKNETHNHPTEIEPFGGAATCLGGAIRDPLSGRSYVYQAMRVTGSGDPRTKIEATLPGKLPQRKISTGAAAGYSSYGNQIGLATGQVTEVYDDDFVAKRMEIGAVIAAAPRENVFRGVPQPGDLVILLGGRTGRDGCGGATGSSKAHTEESLISCGAEVQKGNPPTERKVQRLFRNPVVSKMIKRCNDFGAGGVSVAIGELADGLDVNLDVVPKKYEGLDGTELAISESQERMAVVIAKEDLETFLDYSAQENLEASLVANVTATNRLCLKWRGKAIVDLSREFLDSNGVKQETAAHIVAPDETKYYFATSNPKPQSLLPDLDKAWIENLKDINVCSQKGLVERFDSSIGAGTVLMPFGGKNQATPAAGMVAKIPVLEGNTSTGTIMTFGYDAQLAKWSPFHGALYAVVESVAKVVACGGDYHNIRLTLQEYFEKLGSDSKKWGKPLSALLGAYHAQKMLGLGAIGGKDSMSGTFNDLNVPPSLVSFAVCVTDVTKVISPEFKAANSKIILLPLKIDKAGIPDFALMQKTYTRVKQLVDQGKVLAAQTVGAGGIAAAITKMCFGNDIGVQITTPKNLGDLFMPQLGSLILELPATTAIEAVFADSEYQFLGETIDQLVIKVGQTEIALATALAAWTEPLEKVFPSKAEEQQSVQEIPVFTKRNLAKTALQLAKPRVFLPVFPGTNCEYDTAKAFQKAGAEVNTLVFRNLTSQAIEESVEAMLKGITTAQIIMLPGGFSAGDEPDGSGKFIATVFRNPKIKEAVSRFLQEQDGLMLGICNGFQALIKLGLLPYGEISDIQENSPTLTFNTIGRHISTMVQTKVISTLSPWFANLEAGDIHSIAISHGEGRFVASEEEIQKLIANGQVATQYVGLNPNGSLYGIEGITSPDGRILGKMGHSERIGSNVAKNVPGAKDQQIFAAGVKYFS